MKFQYLSNKHRTDRPLIGYNSTYKMILKSNCMIQVKSLKINNKDEWLENLIEKNTHYWTKHFYSLKKKKNTHCWIKHFYIEISNRKRESSKCPLMKNAIWQAISKKVILFIIIQ